MHASNSRIHDNNELSDTKSGPAIFLTPWIKKTSYQQVIDDIHLKWPEWSRERYWVASASDYPSPDEAASILQAVALFSKKEGIHVMPHYSSLIHGLVECLHLTHIRRLGSPHCIGDGIGVDHKVILSDASICSTFFSLPAVGGHLYFDKEMDVLCNELPRLLRIQIDECGTGNLCALSLFDVRNICWGIRRSRHWTPYLILIEPYALSRISSHTSKHDSKGNVWKHLLIISKTLVDFGEVPCKLLVYLSDNYSEISNDWFKITQYAWPLMISSIVAIEEQREGTEGDQKGLFFGHLHTVFMERLLDEDTAGMNNITMCMMWQYLHTVRIVYPHIWAKYEENIAALYSQVEKAWDCKQHTEPSAVQREAYEMLIRLGYRDAVFETVIGGLSVDIALPSEKIVVEMDGPSHFARNDTTVLVGNSVWKKKLLQHEGWRVVNVHYDDWNALRGDKERREFLQVSIN